MTYSLDIKQVRLNRAQLAATNPVLSSLQLCIELDTNVYTAGDGTSRYLDIRGNVQLTAEERRSADDLFASIATEPLRLFALVAQSGTAAPTLDVGINTIGEFSTVRNSSGSYDIRFPSGTLPTTRTKVWIDPSNVDSMTPVFRAHQGDTQSVTITAADGDSQLASTQLEIIVYP